jgi:PAS domain S-box-containing protein
VSTERNHRILIIDDNPAIHTDFKKILQGWPGSVPSALQAVETALFGEPTRKTPGVVFHVDSAFQGQEGLERVRAALAAGLPYALAFVDVRMLPGWDGIETIEHLWAHDPQLQVVICTAYSDLSWEEITRRLGRSDRLVILKKPFENIEVYQMACALTQKWALAHQLRSQLADLDRLVQQRTHELEATHARLEAEARERRQAVQALRCSEARFAMAFGKSPLPMAIQTLEPELLVDVNGCFAKMLGYTVEELIGQCPKQLALWADPIARHQFLAALHQDRPVQLLECRLRARTGELRDVVLSADKFVMHGTPHALIIAQDVTQQVRLEHKVRQAQKMEAVGRLATGVAHDFNNMLTIIQGHLHLMTQANGAPVDPISSLEQIATVSARGARLTRNLLEFSRKRPVQPRALNLNDLLKRLNHMLARLIGENIEWQCQFEEKLPPVEGDENGLEQVITQLVVNARDAMPTGGHLWLGTAAVEVDPLQAGRNPDGRAGKFVCLTVRDTGTGLSQESVLRIFEPFFNAKEPHKGGDLGLAAAYGIIKQHLGWIEVTSDPVQGSTFQVFLPIAQQVAALRLPEPLAPRPLAGKPGLGLLAA